MKRLILCGLAVGLGVAPAVAFPCKRCVPPACTPVPAAAVQWTHAARPIPHPMTQPLPVYFAGAWPAVQPAGYGAPPAAAGVVQTCGPWGCSR
jgi:hypothetical protein